MTSITRAGTTRGDADGPGPAFQEEEGMSIPYGLLALVQERIAGVLERPGNGLLPELSIDGKLLSQLRDAGVKTPRGFGLSLGKLLDAADLGDLVGAKDDDGLLAKL